MGYLAIEFQRGKMFNMPINNPSIDELALIPQWVCRNGNKVPIDPNTLNNADSTDPKTWSDYETACNAGLRSPSGKAIHGVGFVITESDPFVCIDLDKCIDESKKIAPWAMRIVKK
jgi:primase-polymerase (primpol)-like protein